MQIKDEAESFETFYKKLKADKIKPIIEKEKRLFESRAKKFEKLKSMIERKKKQDAHLHGNSTRPHSRTPIIDPLSMTQAFKGKTSFN